LGRFVPEKDRSGGGAPRSWRQAVANDIEVRLLGSAERTDTDLARAALNALKWDAGIPTDKIDITVSHGWVTLKGEVDHYFQKRDAERAIERLSGVRGVSNLLAVKPQPAPQDLKSQIEKALVRNAEKKAAAETVSSASGVTEVDNRIIVSLPV
jgi:osmotically-inducible protein OsmY